MKVMTGVVLKAIDGSELSRTEQGKPPMPCTLGHVCCEALMTGYRDETGLNGAQKYARYHLAKKIHDALAISASGEIEFTDTELAMVKKLIGMLYQPAVVGPAYDALTPGAHEKIQALS